jgi:hypothetical protein
MRRLTAIGLSAALLGGSAAVAQKAPCPTGEVGRGYPWQTPGLMRGDTYAWMILTVDRTGRPIRCALGDNNIPDPETRFRLCKAYSDDWRAPAATATDPDMRTIRRQTIMTSYAHQMADKKARKAWFRDHPEERPECYPE